MSKIFGRNSKSLTCRILAGLLALLMCLPLMAATVYADDESGTEGEQDDPGERPFTQPEDTYMLVVSTGVAAGDSVLYFGIRYLGTDGIERTQFVFPHDNAMKWGYTEAAKVSSPSDLLNKVKTQTATEPAVAPGEQRGLQPYAYDMYMFECHFPMKQLIDIEIYFKHSKTDAGVKNEWTCSDIRLYNVSKLYGVGMSGYFSADFYIDFEGELMAAFEKKSKNGGDFRIDMNDQIFRLIRGNDPWRTLKTSFDKGDERRHYSTEQSVGNLILRMDLADIYDGGIEALTNEYSDAKHPLHELELCEALTVEIGYRDIFGMIRYTHLPFITSFVLWAQSMCEDLATDPVLGVAQQGDTIAMPITLPDYAELTAFTLFYGSTAVGKAGLTCNASTRQASRYAKLANDPLSYTGISIFEAKGTKTVVSTDGAMLRCSVIGTPAYVFTSSTAGGMSIRPDHETNMFPMLKKTEAETGSGNTSTLIPTVTEQRYIVEINTDLVNRADTQDELFASFTYIAKDGLEKTIDRFSIKDAINEFYGYWPSSDNSCIGYKAGTSIGGKLIFSLTNNDVAYFKSITLSIDDAKSTDEWQMSSLSIYAVSALSQRYAVWEDVKYDTTASRCSIYRSYESYRTEQTYNEKLLLNSVIPSVEITFDGNGSGSTEQVEPDWEKLKYSMTYNEARQKLGFTKTRSRYIVTVNVASNSEITGGTEDCGSLNQFYFQLIFANGKSAYVQANQQLQGDGFRAGCPETFEIITNRDYGDLYAINIIPDDMLDTSAVYDKLKIDMITVQQYSDGGVSRSWRVNNISWIGIDFQDDGLKETMSGKPARVEQDMTRNYLINQKGYSLNFLVALTTGDYGQSKTSSDAAAGFSGALTMTVIYENSSGTTSASFDVAKAIAEYAQKKTSTKTFTYPDKTKKEFVPIDPSYMLRPNHVDRFNIKLDDVKRIISVTFDLFSETDITLNIKGVDIYQVLTAGTLLLNANGEYQRNGKTEFICSEASGIQPLEMIKGRPYTYSIQMQENTININPTSWEAVIDSVPAGDDDVLNFYLWLEDGQKVKDPSAFTLTVKYQMRHSDRTYQHKIRDLRYVEDRNMLYFMEFSSKGISVLRELTLTSTSEQKIDHAIVTQTRANVVINTYYFNFRDLSTNPELGGAVVTPIPDVYSPREEQIVTLNLAADTKDTVLETGGKDVAVQITYTSVNDVYNVEYSSPYIFLTEQEIIELHAGEKLEISFEQKYVKEIKSVSIICRDTITGSVNGCSVMSYQYNTNGTRTCVGQYVSHDLVPISRSRMTMNCAPSNLTSLNLDMSIGSHVAGVDTIGLDIYVTTVNGQDGVITVEDLRPYVVEGGMAADGHLSASMTLEEVSTIRGFVITPYNNEGGIAEIDVRSVTADWSNVDESVSRTFTVNRVCSLKDPLILNPATIDFSLSFKTIAADGTMSVDSDTYFAPNQLAVTIENGGAVSFRDLVKNGIREFSDRRFNLELISGKPQTSGDEKYLARDLEGRWRFTPPVSYDEDCVYLVTVTLPENPDKVFKITVTVKPGVRPPETENENDTVDDTVDGTQGETGTQPEQTGTNTEPGV